MWIDGRIHNFVLLFLCLLYSIAVVVFPTSRIHSSGYFYFVNFTCSENYCLSLQNWTPADQIDTLLRPQKSWYYTVPSHSGIILSQIVQYRNIKMFALYQRVFNPFQMEIWRPVFSKNVEFSIWIILESIPDIYQEIFNF